MSSSPDQCQEFNVLKILQIHWKAALSDSFSKKLFHRTFESSNFLVLIMGAARNTATSKMESLAERDNSFCYCCKTLHLRCLRGVLATHLLTQRHILLWNLPKRLRKEKYSFDFNLIGSINRDFFCKLLNVYYLWKFELIKICKK